MDYNMSSPASTSSSSSSSSSSIHPASLTDAATLNPAVLSLVDLELSRPVIDYLIDTVSDTVDFAMGRPSPRGRRYRNPKFAAFVQTVLSRAEVTTPTVLASLVYIERAKPHLHIALEEWALERVFLGALIVASKYLNDSTLKNVHWAICTGVFGKRDIGRIEREFLDVLDFELSVSDADLMSHHDALFNAVSPSSSPITSPIARPHHHNQHARHHHRHSSIPELEPSSPISSDGTSSPQTPSTLYSSPATGPAVRPQPSKHHGTFHDLIKAFPLPLPHRSSRPVRVQT